MSTLTLTLGQSLRFHIVFTDFGTPLTLIFLGRTIAPARISKYAFNDETMLNPHAE
jgi:hypothetical protein